MRTLREWWWRLIGTLRGRRADGDLEAELRAHLELAGDEARRRGAMDAERAARLRAGGVAQAMDALRDQRGLPWLDQVATDLSRLPRLVRRHRGYFAVATLTLAVGVGVNLVVFTIVNALWLRPLPFKDPDRLIVIANQPFIGFKGEIFRNFEAVAGQVFTLDSMIDLRPNLAFDSVGRDLETHGVTPGYFSLFGLAIRGRDFTSDDDLAGAEPVAIISDRLWSREFSRRTDVIGSVVAAKPLSIRVIGVAPPGFEGPQRGEKADVWIPAHLVPRVATNAASAADVFMIAFARLRPGQTAAEIKQHILESASATDRPFYEGFSIVPLKDVYGTPDSWTIVIREGGALGVVAGLALLVLLGGCATLTALVLVHYERRRADLAVRLALGASRRRLAGELSRELAAVAVAGTIGALLIATWGLGSIPSLSLPGGVNLARLDLSIDWRVMSAAIGATALTLLVAGLLPIARFTRARLAGELLAGPAPTASVSSQRVRQLLLSLHVAATIVVLVAAGLFVRAVIYGFGSGPGFDARGTVFVKVRIRLAPSDAPKPIDVRRQEVAARTDRLIDALRSVPGVDAVATGTAPIDEDWSRFLLTPKVIESQGTRRELSIATPFAHSPEWLSALGVPILAGRALTPADATATPRPAVVTASLARTLWPGAGPVGQVLSVTGGGRGGGSYQVVGVARDFVFGSFSAPAAGVVVSAGGNFGAEPQLVIHGADAEALVKPIQNALKAFDPASPYVSVTTGREIVARDLGRQRLGAWFFSGFGLTALLLGVGGVFGLVAYLAESRRREFGVRVALGATPRDLVRRGLAAALTPVLIGIVAGLLVAALVARLFTSLLAGLSALDPLTYAIVAMTMLACAGLAGLGAAWRLRRMMPSDALRTN